MSSIFKRSAQTSINNPEVDEKKSSKTSIFKRPKLQEEEESIENEDEGDENFLQKGVRGAGRTAWDVIQTLRAAPGDIFSFVNDFTGPITANITGEKLQPYEQTHLSRGFPSSSMIRKQSPEYLKPKTEGEALGSEFVQDVTSLFLPTTGKGKVAAKGLDWIKRAGERLAKATGLAGAGLVAKEGAEKLGVDAETARKLKMGIVFAGSLGMENGWKGAEKYKNDLYSEMRNSRPVGATISAGNLLTAANNFKKKLLQGGTSPSSSKSLTKVDELIESIQKQKGHIGVEELEDFAIKTNELKSGLYQEYQLDKVGRKAARANLDKVTKIVENQLIEYGKTNPKYAQARAAAQEVHGAIESSRGISKYIEKNAKSLGTAGGGGLLVQALTHPEKLLTSIGVGTASLVAVKGGEFIARVVKSPKLREYYLNVLDGAARRDAVFMNHNIQKLEKEIEKDPKSLLED